VVRHVVDDRVNDLYELAGSIKCPVNGGPSDTMSRNKIRSFILAVICLLAGSLIYILFRPTTLLMFNWTESLGLMNIISSMRAWADGYDKFLPGWIIYSLPFGLWVSSYMFFIDCIWGRSQALALHVWFWAVPVIAITAEFVQLFSIIPGHFDFIDLLIIFLAAIFGFLATGIYKSNKGIKHYEQEP